MQSRSIPRHETVENYERLERRAPDKFAILSVHPGAVVCAGLLRSEGHMREPAAHAVLHLELRRTELRAPLFVHGIDPAGQRPPGSVHLERKRLEKSRASCARGER